MISKRGLSNVVATVLIVLLSLAAVGIVWAFIAPLLENTGEAITLRQKCFDVRVKPTSCINNSATNYDVSVQLLNGDPEDIDSIGAIVTINNENTKGNTEAAPNLLETQNIAVTLLATERGKTARAVAIVKDSDGNTETCAESAETVTCTSAVIPVVP